jgi:hypothetical protein
LTCWWILCSVAVELAGSARVIGVGSETEAGLILLARGWQADNPPVIKADTIIFAQSDLTIMIEFILLNIVNTCNKIFHGC